MLYGVVTWVLTLFAIFPHHAGWAWLGGTGEVSTGLAVESAFIVWPLVMLATVIGLGAVRAVRDRLAPATPGETSSSAEAAPDDARTVADAEERLAAALRRARAERPDPEDAEPDRRTPGRRRLRSR